LGPEVPVVAQGQTGTRLINPIDAFILEKLVENGLSFSPEADRRTLARRVFLDLTGLPPSPEELEEFLRDSRSDAYERLVSLRCFKERECEPRACPFCI